MQTQENYNEKSITVGSLLKCSDIRCKNLIHSSSTKHRQITIQRSC